MKHGTAVAGTMGLVASAVGLSLLLYRTPAAATPISTTIASASDPAASTSHLHTILIRKDVVIGIQVDQAIDGGSARVGDRLAATVARDVVMDDVTMIAEGTRLEGVITDVQHSARVSRGKLGVRFTALVDADGIRVPMQTEVIVRDGEAAGTAWPSLDVTPGFGSGGPSRGASPRAAQAATPLAPAAYRDAHLPAGSFLTVHLTAPLSLTIGRNP